MKQFIRRNLYKWHRAIGLVTIIPVIFWCLSGLMHPFLAHWFKPKIAHEFMPPKPLNSELIKLPLKEVLERNNIKAFKNSRIVQFKGKSYYQVKTQQDEWLYFDTQTGEEYPDGDKQYAEYLARFFLDDSLSAIQSITLQTEFTREYRYVNRLLPVWKVCFERADAMDVYVETPYSRLATFNPISRKIFLWIFDNFHNWTFLAKISNDTLRVAIMILFLTTICISALLGVVIYGLLWGKFKKPNPQNKRGILRKYHRQIGIAVAFVTLAFAFSGGYHATRKLKPNLLPQMVYEPIIYTQELPDSLPSNLDWKRTNNIAFVKTPNGLFYQIFQNGDKNKTGRVLYVNTSTNQEWINGNTEYAIFLANKFKDMKHVDSGQMVEPLYKTVKNTPNILGTEDVTKFEQREYGLIFKRLPVVRVSYNTPEKTNLYIETSTSRLAARIENADRYEGYSFAILHKFLWMDWAGKDIRDLVMMFSALGVLLVSILGFVLYLKK